MFEKKNLLLIGFIGLILGFFIIQQFYLHNKITKTIQPENENNLALEVSDLIKTNQELNQEISDLTSEQEKLSNSAADAEESNKALEENLIKYKIILGLVEVYGEGVQINFDSKISSVQLIDLLNAIKNIGAEAIQVNDQRITTNSTINSGFFNPPVVIKVIGDKNLLNESLVRTGGILEQIGFGKVEKKDELVIEKKK